MSRPILLLLLAAPVACGARSGLPDADPPGPGSLSAPGECESVGAPPNALGVVQLSAGPAHTCALLQDGTVRCWGRNAIGQLGDGTFVDRAAPTAVVGLTDVAQIAAGGTAGCNHYGCSWGQTCAVKTDGTLLCWGDAGPPSRGLGPVRRVVVADDEVCAIVDDLSVRCQEVGEAPFEDVPELAGSVAVTSNSLGRCGLGSDGSVRCLPAADAPGVPSTRGGAVDIAAGLIFTCAWNADGSGACFGWDYSHVVGTDDVPDQIFLDWQEQPPIDCGREWTVSEQHACRRTLDGRLFCWGSPLQGKLGTTPKKTGPLDGDWLRAEPTEVAGLSGVLHAAAGHEHTCAVTDTDVWCWGSNSHGQLGDGTVGGETIEPRRVAW